MAKIPYATIPRALTPTKALTALLGAASIQYLVITSDFEGYVPIGYMDPVNIPTKCFGDTTNVVVGKKYTFEECERSLNEHSVEIIKPVRKCIKGFDQLPDKSKAAIASMAYNIGPKAMCESTITKYANAKNYTRMCSRMREIYLYATDRKTGKKVVLKGLEIRRNREADLCEAGFRELEGVKDETIEAIIESSPSNTGLSPRYSQPADNDTSEVVREAPSAPSLLGRILNWLRNLV